MYNRDYLTDGKSEEVYSQYEQQTETRQQDLVGFLRTTYQLFASSLMAATVGAYIGLGMASVISTWYWGLFILELVLLFSLYAVKDKPGINLAVLFGFTFISGLTLTPLLSSVFHMPGGASIVAQAFLMTSVAFGAISMFALTTKKDFSFMGKFLFIAVIILIVGSLGNIFFFSSPILQLGIAMVGALVFSAFILYDTQQIIKGGFSTPIEAAIALYLDFLNLFISLVQILAAFAGNRDD
ncbi:MAG TPA: Bax inhibitor-1/YccA family protein [Arcobacter sp.]|nr:Bax inhibitor-1/YccA family protein [Arcobacter sp.]